MKSTCSVSSMDMDLFRSYGVPDSKVVMPSSIQTVLDSPRDMVAVYIDFFDKSALRFPLTQFFCCCLLYYDLCITQMTPDFVSCVVGFEVLCRVARIEPSVSLFSYFFCPYKCASNPDWYNIKLRFPNPTKWILNLPECVDWKTRFVFIARDMFPEMKWNRKTHNLFPKPDLKISLLNEIRTLSGFDIQWTLLLSKTMLHVVKMPYALYKSSAVDFPDSASQSKRRKQSTKDIALNLALGESIATPSNRERSGLTTLDDNHVQVANLLPRDFSPSKRYAEFEEALGEIRRKFADSESIAEKYQQGLDVERKKNVALQAELEKQVKQAEKERARAVAAHVEVEKERARADASQKEAKTLRSQLDIFQKAFQTMAQSLSAAAPSDEAAGNNSTT